MSSKPTYLEHDMVNILASMTLKVANYPTIFYEAGYRVENVEKEFDITIEGEPREVKFDIVLNNLQENHSIPCECKSGSTEAKQLAKYSEVTSSELVRVGGIASNNPSMHTHDMTIVFNEVNHDRIIEETDAYDFVHLSVSRDPTKITLGERIFQDDNLEAFFSTAVDYPNHVLEIFRVNGQTPLEKYIKIVAAELVAFSINGKEKCTLIELAPMVASTYPGFFPSKIGEQMRKEIERKIERALLEGSKYELRDYFSWDRRTQIIQLRKIKPGCKTSTYKVFKDEASMMAERMRKKESPSEKYKREKVDPNQISLIQIEQDEF